MVWVLVSTNDIGGRKLLAVSGGSERDADNKKGAGCDRWRRARIAPGCGCRAKWQAAMPPPRFTQRPGPGVRTNLPYALGDMPIAFLKARLKAKIDSKPQAFEISSMLPRSGFASIDAAMDRRDSRM